MKLLLKILLVVLAVFFIGFIIGFFDLGKAVIGVLALFVLGLLVSALNTLSRYNPFDRKFKFLTEKSERYHLSSSTSFSTHIYITLRNLANPSDLQMALCEHITRYGDFSGARITISANGDSCINSDQAFSPFSMDRVFVSFASHVPASAYSNSFFCGSTACGLLEPPCSVPVVCLENPCRTHTIRISGGSLPTLDADPKTRVPSDFTILIPNQLHQQAEKSSWFTASFVDESGRSVNPIHFY